MSRPVIAAFIAQSVDGYIAAVDGGLDWLTAAACEDEDYGFDSFVGGVDLVAMGRATYDVIKDLAELPYQGRPIHVFTHQQLAPRDGFEFYARTPQEAVDAWAQTGVSAVYLDGGSLISQFLAAGLVDELTITTVPVLLGSGTPLFHPIDVATPLRLVGSEVFSSGMVTLHYQSTA